MQLKNGWASLTPLLVFALAGCGGGGGDAASPVIATNSAKVFPDFTPDVGDYLVYSVISTPTLPAGQNPRATSLTDHYTIVNSDGSLNRTRTLSDSTATSPSITFAFDGGGKLVGRTQPNRNCTYSPAYRPVAPASAVIGEAYSTSTTLACQYLPNGSATATNVTLNGTVLAAESLTVGAGTFDTVKMTQTESTSNTALTTTSIQNYWTDRITGRTIKVTSSYTETPTGKIAPSYQENNARELIGYYLKGQKGGAIVRRFAGNWAMVIEDGQDRFNCPISVDSNGQFSGNNCDGTPVVINGVVGESGAASGSTGDGASFSGTFTSPSRATGTWKNGSNSGTWTAAHQ